MSETLLAKIAALKTTPTPELKSQWRELYGSPPPPFNRKYLENRLAYRIQELTLGGLRPETRARLEALGEDFDGGRPAVSKRRLDQGRPVAGTTLIREWQGTEHRVGVTDEGYVHRGRPYRSLSAVARPIAGTRWNGWLFFGLRNPGRAA